MKQKSKFKQTKIGKIPEDWEVKELGEVAEIVGGGTPSTKNPEYWDGDIAWITPKDLSTFKFRYIKKGERNITKKGLENSSAKLLPNGTILLTTRAPIGYLAIAENKVTTNQGFRNLIPNHKTTSEFLFYLLKNNVEILKSNASGTTFGELSGSRLKTIQFSFPPLPEQRAIASILSSLDNKIELNQKMNKTLEAIGQAIFKRWFIDFEFPDDEGKPYKSSGGEMVYNEELDKEIPKGWRVGKMKDVADVNWGDTNITKSDYKQDGFLAYSASGPDGYRDKFDYDKAGIVVSAIGEYCGKTWWAQGKWSCIKNTIRIFGEKIETSYLYFLTKNENFWKKRGAAQPFLTKGDIDDTLLLIPSNELLKRFNTISLKIFDKIYNNFLENRILSQIRNLLLPRLMSGKIRVPIEINEQISNDN